MSHRILALFISSIVLSGCGSDGTTSKESDAGAGGAAGSGSDTETGGTGNPDTGGQPGVGGRSSGGGAAGKGSSGGGTAGKGSSAGGTSTVTNPDGGSTEVALADLPGELSAAACVALGQCLGVASSSFFDGKTCSDLLGPATAEGSLALVPALVDSGKVTYDGTKVADCLDTIRGSGCDYANRRQNALCPGVLTGTVATGGDCTLNAECSGEAYCKIDAACPGACTPLVSAGGACAGDDDCADGLSCDATSKTCITAGKKGDACSATKPCGDGFFCRAAKCVELATSFAAAAGATCDPANSALCKTGLTCALTGVDAQQKGIWKCESPATGATCHVAVPEQCPAGQYCELPGDIVGTCKKAPAAGAACVSRLPSDTTTAKDVCGTGLTCSDDGKCHGLSHLGGSCTSDGNCYSGTCRDGKCVAGTCAP